MYIPLSLSSWSSCSSSPPPREGLLQLSFVDSPKLQSACMQILHSGWCSLSHPIWTYSVLALLETTMMLLLLCARFTFRVRVGLCGCSRLDTRTRDAKTLLLIEIDRAKFILHVVWCNSLPFEEESFLFYNLVLKQIAVGYCGKYFTFPLCGCDQALNVDFVCDLFDIGYSILLRTFYVDLMSTCSEHFRCLTLQHFFVGSKSNPLFQTHFVGNFSYSN